MYPCPTGHITFDKLSFNVHFTDVTFLLRLHQLLSYYVSLSDRTHYFLQLFKKLQIL
jgi:hypothetical protein